MIEAIHKIHLHSNMILLILEEAEESSIPITNLHSNMFLLIRIS